MCKSFDCTSLCPTVYSRCPSLRACVTQSHAYKLVLYIQLTPRKGPQVQLWPAVDWRETSMELIKETGFTGMHGK